MGPDRLNYRPNSELSIRSNPTANCIIQRLGARLALTRSSHLTAANKRHSDPRHTSRFPTARLTSHQVVT